jgi:iron(III) transport system permease protein
MFFGIVLPLIMPSFLSGWFVVAIVMSGNLAIPILLSSSSSPTVPLLVYQLYTQGQTARAAALFVIVLGGLIVGLLLVTALSALLRRRFAGRAATAAVPLAPAAEEAAVPLDLAEPLPVGSR